MTEDGNESKSRGPVNWVRRNRTLVICLVAGMLLGISQPLGEMWIECRRNQFDACGWDRTLLPFTVGLGAILGLGFGVILNAFVHLVRSPQTPEAPETQSAQDEGSSDGKRT